MTFELFCVVAECCLAFFGALLASLAITPIVRARAEEWGFVDRPDGGRKAHGRVTALGGGVAVFVAALAAAGLAFAAMSARHIAPEQRVVNRLRADWSVEKITSAAMARDLRADPRLIERVHRQIAAGATDTAIAEALGKVAPAADVQLVEKVRSDFDNKQHWVEGVVRDFQANPQAFARTYATLLGKIAGAPPFYFGLLAAVILICAVGLLDDYVELPGRYKLAGQVVATLILVVSGLVIEKVAIFDRSYELGILAVPFTMFWLLGAINAINLLDGIDGLASSVGLVLSLTLAAMALLGPQMHEVQAIIALALAGALLGFLRFNFAPASIFLGDSGSMLIGLVVGAIAIRCSFKGPTTVALAVPVALWAIPIFDSAAAIVRRKLTGRSLFATDRGHLHHSLLVRGWSVRKTVLFIGVICAATCLSALLSYYLQNEWIAWTSVAAVITLLILMGIFGHVELALVRARVRSTTRALASRSEGAGRRVSESRIRLQGSQEWDHLWTALTESAEHYNLTRIELTLDLPALHEGFYANWSCPAEGASGQDWRVVCPLSVGSQKIGTLVVMGVDHEEASLRHIGRVADFLEPVEESLRKVVASISREARVKQRSGELAQDEDGTDEDGTDEDVVEDGADEGSSLPVANP
jgi:UDP-GlcNAc:undecaprenyl-phosphate GlcNAc-1-phosphate transferase